MYEEIYKTYNREMLNVPGKNRMKHFFKDN